MQMNTLIQTQILSVINCRCNAKPGDKSYTEQFGANSISYVHKGSFGCRTRGRDFEFVPGSFLIGHAGDEYRCTHDHHAGGDECLSFLFLPEAAGVLCDHSGIWRLGCIPPLPEMVVLGELAKSASRGTAEVGVEEIGLVLAQRLRELLSTRGHRQVNPTARDRRRAVEAALWIDAHSHESIGLDAIAGAAGLSAFHFLRTFGRVFGVTPHQYLLRSRLRHAARLLAEEAQPITEVAFGVGFNDLSNFVRTFHKAAGISPYRFRRASAGERKIFQERLDSPG